MRILPYKLPIDLVKKLKGKLTKPDYIRKRKYFFDKRFDLAFDIHDNEYNHCETVWNEYEKTGDESELSWYENHKYFADEALRHNIKILMSYKTEFNLKTKRDIIILQPVYKQIFGVFLGDLFYYWFKYFGNPIKTENKKGKYNAKSRRK